MAEGPPQPSRPPVAEGPPQPSRPPAAGAARPPSESRAVLTRWMGVADASFGDNVHGGVIMRLCDEVAGIAAIRHSGRMVVTAAVDRLTFAHRVFVGDLVTVRATVNAAWRSSMEVGVRVEREDLRTGELAHTSTAYLTMVALGDDGRPTPVPALAPATAVDERRHREAELRRRNRLAEREAITRERDEE